jgi:MFS superfamily sulfate permease-like transporter
VSLPASWCIASTIGLFFANARYVRGRVLEALRGAPTPARWLVFDAESVAHVDATGADALRDIARDLLRDRIGASSRA